MALLVSACGDRLHWAPEGLELLAPTLSNWLARNFDLGTEEVTYVERPVVVEGRGDLLAMLRLPAGQRIVSPERVTIRTIADGFGSSWRPSPLAPILLLGDSFTNIYSDPRLGYGENGPVHWRI